MALGPQPAQQRHHDALEAVQLKVVDSQNAAGLQQLVELRQRAAKQAQHNKRARGDSACLCGRRHKRATHKHLRGVLVRKESREQRAEQRAAEGREQRERKANEKRERYSPERVLQMAESLVRHNEAELAQMACPELTLVQALHLRTSTTGQGHAARKTCINTNVLQRSKRATRAQPVPGLSELC